MVSEERQSTNIINNIKMDEINNNKNIHVKKKIKHHTTKRSKHVLRTIK